VFHPCEPRRRSFASWPGQDDDGNLLAVLRHQITNHSKNIYRHISFLEEPKIERKGRIHHSSQNEKYFLITTTIMRCLDTTLVFTLLSPVFSWLPHQHSVRPTTRLASSEQELPDFEGKTIYQRCFYRLSPGSTVSKPNALLIEERLRFKADPGNKGYILPFGPRTYIFREGTNEDEITDELYRIHLGSATHNGPGTMDTSIATILYLASNPEMVQGDVLQLGCESGIAGILGCIGARFAMNPKRKSQDAEDVFTVPKHEDVFPPKMHHLTLSDEGDDEGMRATYDIVKHFSNGEVSLKDIRWGTRIPGRRYDHYYRTIIGSDMDFSYPNSKELARTVANYLLPSNEFAVISTKDGASTSGGSSGGGSFGGIGMDMESSAPAPQREDPMKEVNSNIAPTFVHVCPDARENVTYLRQFLENGFKMTVNSDYLKLGRLQFVFQTLPEDAPEDEIEDLDLELKDESSRSYQSLTAFHHPDYAGDGTGEYFFPLETGEYEGGSRSTYLEPEEESSPW
jgi:hypothetical protein